MQQNDNFNLLIAGMILRQNLPFADQVLLNYVVSFLQLAHMANERYTVRDGINIARYALKLAGSDQDRGLSPKDRLDYLAQAALLILGRDALAYLPGDK